MELTERIADLERRVARLEGRPTPAAVVDEETFWVLAGLRERHGGTGAVTYAGTVRLPDGRELEWQEGLSTDVVLEQDWREAADLLAALGHPVRLALLQRFAGGAATVAEATADEEFGTTGQVYHHLRQLVATGWLHALGGGRYVVPAQRVVPLLSIVMGAHR